MIEKLLKAIKENNTNEVLKLIDGVSSEEFLSYKYTYINPSPLSIAARYGNLKAFTTIFNKVPELIHIKADWGGQPVNNLLSEVCDSPAPMVACKIPEEPLCKVNKVQIFKLLIEKVPQFVNEICSSQGPSMLRSAIKWNFNEVVKLLLSMKPELVNVGFFGTDWEQQTLLHLATMSNNCKFAKMFLSKKPELADVSTLSKYGPTYKAIEIAAIKGSHNIFKLLIENNPKLIDNVHNSTKASLLHQACRGGNLETVKLVLNMKPELLNVVDNMGNTPLHYSYSRKNNEVHKLIFKHKPDLIKIENSRGCTALHTAIMISNEFETIKWLIKKCDDLLVIKPDETLRLASNRGRFDVAELLINQCPQTVSSYNIPEAIQSYIQYLVVPLKYYDDFNHFGTGMIPMYNIKTVGVFPPKSIISSMNKIELQYINSSFDKPFEKIKEHIEKTAVELNEQIQQNPEIAENYFYRGNILYALGRTEEALDSYRGAYRIDSSYEKKITDNIQEMEEVTTSDLLESLKNGASNREYNVDLKAQIPDEKKPQLSTIEDVNGKNDNSLEIPPARDDLDINSIDNEGRTIFHYAVEKGDKQAIRKLMGEMRPEVLALSDNLGRTGLHLAPSLEIANMLIEEMPSLTKKIIEKNNLTNSQILMNRLKGSATSTGYKQEIGTLDGVAGFSRLSIEKKAEHGTLDTESKATTDLRNVQDNLMLNDKNDRKYFFLSSPSNNNASEITIEKDKEDINPSVIASSLYRNKGNQVNGFIKENNKGAEPMYNNDRIKNLIEAQIDSNNSDLRIIDLRNGKLSQEKINTLIEEILKTGKNQLLALNVHDDIWTGLTLKKNGELVQLLYNDPRGLKYNQEKNVKALIRNLRDIVEDKGFITKFIDFRCMQKGEETGFFTIENLALMANNEVSKVNSNNFLPKYEEAGLAAVKLKHSFLEDTDPWYSSAKFQKILEIQLRNKPVYRAEIADGEDKQKLNETIQDALKQLKHGVSVVVPITLKEHAWVGLTFKFVKDESLQIVYNNPNGNPLVSEKCYGTIMKAVAKFHPNFHLIDFQLAQLNDIDDSGAFTIENLVSLATTETSGKTKSEMQHLIKLPTGGIANEIRDKHLVQLNNEGIPVKAQETQKDSQQQNDCASQLHADENVVNENLFDATMALSGDNADTFM